MVDQSVVLTGAQLALAEHLAESTLAPLSACINLMLPVGLTQMADTCYSLNLPPPRTGGRIPTDLQRRILGLLDKRGPLLGRQINRALPRVRWRPAIRSLVNRKMVITQPVLPAPSVNPKSVRTVRLACTPEFATSKMEDLGRKGAQARERRQAIMRNLLNEPGPVEVSWVYAASGGNLQDLRHLEKMGLVAFGEGQVWRDPLEGVEFITKDPPQLTEDQSEAWQEISRCRRSDPARPTSYRFST
jgi:primosomal protein N' (replication factor Y)